MKCDEAKRRAKAALQQMITAARQYLKAEEVLLGNSTNSRKDKDKTDGCGKKNKKLMPGRRQEK